MLDSILIQECFKFPRNELSGIICFQCNWSPKLQENRNETLDDAVPAVKPKCATS